MSTDHAAQTVARTAAMTAGRRADTTRRHQRVTTALQQAIDAGDEITVATIARRAGVDRSFLYRHPDLLATIHTAPTQPTHSPTAPTVSRASLQADLAAAQHRYQRQAAHIHQLETRLSELLGEQTWRATGLGDLSTSTSSNSRSPNSSSTASTSNSNSMERTQELDAARAANRALMIQLNSSSD